MNVLELLPGQLCFWVHLLSSFSRDKVAGFSLCLGLVMVESILLGALDFEVCIFGRDSHSERISCGPPASGQAVDAAASYLALALTPPPRRDRLLHALEGLAPMAQAMGFGARVCWVRPRRADWTESWRSLALHTRPFRVVLGPVAMGTALPSDGMSTTRASSTLRLAVASLSS